MCQVTGHHVDRHRVWHDSISFRASCERCGEALLREPEGRWRAFDADLDGTTLREPRPGDGRPEAR